MKARIHGDQSLDQCGYRRIKGALLLFVGVPTMLGGGGLFFYELYQCGKSLFFTGEYLAALWSFLAVIGWFIGVLFIVGEVRQGRMQAGDPGLRAITEAWLSSYRQVLEKGEVLDQQALRRLDPSPRLELLIEAGIMPADHQGIEQLRAVYREALTNRSA